MLDKDVAEFYSTNTGVLNRARLRKSEFFNDITFQLTKDEYNEILALEGAKPTSKYLPMVYTEAGAYQMAMVLDSKTSLKVAKLIIDVFMAYKQGQLLPAVQDNRTLQLEHRLIKVENELKGLQAIQYNFHAPIQNFIQGSQVNHIGTKDELVLELAKMMLDSNVNQNKEVMSTITKAIDHSHKGDKKGILENLKSLVDLGAGITSLSTGIPKLIEAVKVLF